MLVKHLAGVILSFLLFYRLIIDPSMTYAKGPPKQESTVKAPKVSVVSVIAYWTDI